MAVELHEVTMLAAVSRDVRRLDLVVEAPEEAASIIEAVLGAHPSKVVSAKMSYVTNDYMVVIPASAVVTRQEYVDFGVIDAALTNIGRVTATVIGGTEET